MHTHCIINIEAQYVQGHIHLEGELLNGCDISLRTSKSVLSLFSTMKMEYLLVI